MWEAWGWGVGQSHAMACARRVCRSGSHAYVGSILLTGPSISLAQGAKFLDLVNSQPRVGGRTKSCLDVVSDDLETLPGETAWTAGFALPVISCVLSGKRGPPLR